MRSIYLLIVCLALQINCSYHAQQLQFNWTHDTIGGPALLMKCDAGNNLYIYYSQISSTTDFDKSASTVTLNTANGFAALAKYDSDGNLVWAKNFGNTQASPTMFSVVDFEIAASGNIYLTGYFNGSNASNGYNTTSTVDINPSPTAITSLTNQNGPDAFVAKFDSNCNYVWAFSFGNNQQYTLPCGFGGTCYYTRGVTPAGLSLDQSEFVYIGGSVSGTGNDADPGTNVVNLNFTSGAYSNGFYCKYSSVGAYVASYVYSTSSQGTNPSSEVYDLICDGNNDLIVSVQTRQAAIDLDPGVGTNMQGSSGVYFSCLAKYSSAGSIVWGYGRQSLSVGYKKLKVNAQNDIFSFGNTGQSNLNLLSGTSVSFATVPLVKYNSSAVLQYAFVPNTDSYNILDYAIKSNDEIYVVGKCGPTVDFDPSAATYTSPSFSNMDGYISKYSGSTFQYAHRFGSNPTSYLSQVGSVCYSNNHIFITGIADGGSDLDFSSLTNAIRPNYYMFLAKYFECYTPSAPSDLTPAASKTICTGLSTTLLATSAGTVSWFLPTSTLAIATGTAFNTSTLSAGIYSYLAVAKTCTTSVSATSIQITVLPNPSVSASGGTICSGQNFTVNPVGASVYTITGGSMVVSPTVSSNYTITGTSTAGCVDSVGAVVTVLVNQNPTVSVVSSADTICVRTTATLTAMGADSYLWAGVQTGSVLVLSPSTTSVLAVVGTSSAGCSSSTSFTQYVLDCDALNIKTIAEDKIGCKIFPNPSTKTIFIQTNQSQKVSIYAIDGSAVREIELQSGTNEIELSDIAKGLYYLKFEGGVMRLVLD